MSLITGCPACGTMFRVVPDQLKISEGWVRCGHCGEVFDASAHLTDEAGLEAMHAEAAGPPAQPPAEDAFDASDLPPPTTLLARPESDENDAAPAGEPVPGAYAAVPLEDAPSQTEAEAEMASGPQPLAEPAEEAESVEEPQPVEEPEPAEEAESAGVSEGAEEPEPTEEPDTAEASQPADASQPPSQLKPAETEDPELEPSPLDTPFVFRRSDLIVAEDEAEPARPREVRAEEEPDEAPEELTPAEVQDVGFMRQAQRREFWRRPGVRLGLVFASVLLSALLVLQFLHRDRDRLALAHPGLRPVLESMCSPLDCTLSAPRQIDSLVIESSGFNRVRTDTYRLAFTLRSNAPVPLAVPAMELTITDVQDQPIARRVLVPADFGAATDVIPPSGDLSRAVGLVIVPSENARVAGYRLLAFYP